MQERAGARRPRSSPRETEATGQRLGRALRRGGVYTGAEKAPSVTPSKLQTYRRLWPRRWMIKALWGESLREGGLAAREDKILKVEEMRPREGA